MNQVCVICFDEMDMQEFHDRRESTQTCFKLECGHAFHTKCIIQCLSNTNHKCPSCNKEKTPFKELTRDGLARSMIQEMKKDDTVKFLLNEHAESRLELSQVTKQLQKDTKEFVEKRKKEIQYEEKKKYFVSCESRLESAVRNCAKQKGPQYVGSLETIRRENRYHYYGSYLSQMLFGRDKSRCYHRLKYPYFRMRM